MKYTSHHNTCIPCYLYNSLSGGELFDRLVDENHILTEPEVIDYMRQICEGIQHMHEKHILHLDMKVGL